MSELTLVVDSGTSATKAAVVDERLRVVSSARERTPVATPERGHRQIDMTELASCTFRVTRAALAKVDRNHVAGIAVTGQGDGAWLLNGAGEPAGPAILWNDARSAEVFVRMQQAGEIDRIRRTTHGSVHPGSLPVIARYLSEYHPKLLASVHAQLNCKDWIRFQFTGFLETDPTDACRSYWDARTERRDLSLMDSLGDLPAAAMLPLSMPGNTRPLTAEAARALGLPAGIPVGTGAMDVASTGYAFCGTRTEQPWAIVGTTSFVGVARRSTRAEAGNLVAYGIPGLVINSLAPMVGTPLLEWLRDFVNAGGQSWEQFEARAAEAGKRGGAVPTALPYFSPSGERAPFADAYARGSVHGLTHETSSAEFAYAVYASIAQTLQECAEDLDIAGTIRIAGGGAASNLLCQLLADFSGHVVERPQVSDEAAILGEASRLLGRTDPAWQSEGTELASATFEPSAIPTRPPVELSDLRRLRAAERPLWPLFRNERPASERSSS
ncbi:xylulokinase/erythritol kinase [Tamaricihabitans halophyticus]|uniref:Xylulokinase/erythritol kinase n=1 Tax=Tamaricihabitans halophyticus TaxID=1262583 RepID=A0A4R2QGZ4_9PSEU|nr:FGGY family carbohydrate kinase [Tamaricihabitans halophyticus]TCP47844.1 xylulokinase/erythritol kinase [Tamaricihabitans halophyticus]